MTPTARTLTLLRRRGYLTDVVERFIAGAGERGQGIRRNLFGCIDVVAIGIDEPGVLGIQATTIGHVAHRLAKARGRPELRTWLAAGNRFEVWGWARRAGRWRVKIVALTGEDLAAVVLESPRRRRGGRKWQQFAPLFGEDGPASPENRGASSTGRHGEGPGPGASVSGRRG
jgi:hypothetical protein